MYKCPIELELITTRIQAETENEIFKAVQKVGVNVDKDELVRVLQYDREQYNKGYEDGYNDAIDIFFKEILEKNRGIHKGVEINLMNFRKCKKKIYSIEYVEVTQKPAKRYLLLTGKTPVEAMDKFYKLMHLTGNIPIGIDEYKGIEVDK